VAALGSVALYTSYYVGEAKVAAITLYATVGTLTVVWAVSFSTLLLTTDRKYVPTLFSTETARNFVVGHFESSRQRWQRRAPCTDLLQEPRVMASDPPASAGVVAITL
jgi:hypothetical protein